MSRDSEANDELRDEKAEQDSKRQELRDEAFETGDDDAADRGSQDERRKDGLGRL